jgi:hypothetical protein
MPGSGEGGASEQQNHRGQVTPMSLGQLGGGGGTSGKMQGGGRGHYVSAVVSFFE